MFSEELTGNASRKRAEENRARRRRLKEQQAKNATTTALGPEGASSKNAGGGVPSTPASGAPVIVVPTAIPQTTANGNSTFHPEAKTNVPVTISSPTNLSSSTILPLANPGGGGGGGAHGQQRPLSAVERAEHERQLRAQVAREAKAATLIESLARFFLSNRTLRSELAQVLEKRLSDLATLGKILQAKNVKVPSTSTSSSVSISQPALYVPPAATTTSFVQQLLFVSRVGPYQRLQKPIGASQGQIRSTAQCLPVAAWCPLLRSLLELCVLPALECSPADKDDDTATTTTSNLLERWTETLQGRRRLEGLIRLAVVGLFSPDAPTDVRSVVVRFVRALLVPSSSTDASSGESRAGKAALAPCRTTLRRYSRSLLLMKAVPSYFDPPPAASKSAVSLPTARNGTTLDLIVSLRYYLMFVSASHPIPSNAKDLRDRCIPEASQAVGRLLWTLILDGIRASENAMERQLLRCRVVSDLLTVPLLSWKLGSGPMNAFVSPTTADGKIELLDVLRSFVELHSEALGSGAIQQLVVSDGVPLTVCPATQLQCLLANLVQLAILSPALNGSDPSRMDSGGAVLLYTFLSTLLDVIPVVTFSSRDSSVEWMTDGRGHHTPIVLSPVVLDQCKLLLLDSFVRRLFGCAAPSVSMNIESALAQKNDRDMKHEQSLLESGAASASALAAREARVDRSLGFWNSSKWARRITKGVSSMLSGEAGSPTTHPASPSHARRNQDSGVALVNTSAMSRLLAGGKRAESVTASVKEQDTSKNGRYDPGLFIVLCRMYGIVLSRWGGGGHDDLSRKGSKGSATERNSKASLHPEVCTMSLLNVLGFSTQMIKITWFMIQTDATLSSEIDSIVDPDYGSVSVRSHWLRPSYKHLTRRSEQTQGNGVILLYMFVATLVHVLIVTDDIEIHDMERPLPVHHIRRCVEMLKKLLYRACYLDDQSNAVESNYFGLALISTSSRAMRDLYDRSSRRPICVPKLWLVPDLFDKEIRQCKTHSDFVALLSHPVLRVCPFLVSFKRRLKIFERIVTTSRIEIQGVNDMNPFNPNPLKPGIPVRIMRGRLLEDGLATMNHLGSNMRRRIAVQYVNEAGVQETGIDAGGLFKEFWTDLSAIAFNPNYALFRVTEGAGNCLYPNHSSGAAHGTDHIVLFEFLGRILGKALYEGITINPCFAHFFLSFLRGDYNYLHMLPDLSTVDPQLYNNLMFLKTYDGDAADLCLTFTITSDEFGGTKEIPLIPNGASVEVTSSNKQRYIGLVAKHYVVDRVKEQSEAFTRGLWEVIDRSWLRIFNEPELQVLISGPSDGKINLDDLRANTKYVGGYTGLDRNIGRFWSVVGSMDPAQQQGLLRFVTSCERPPPLGFASMNPAFTIQRVGLTRDDGKLPTASTCFNTLKLPIYSSDKVMKERLLYAIRSGAGFELT